ncbi:hypothetical protein D3C81_1043750 [compost metagenome]
MLTGEGIGDLDHLVEGLGLVVGKIGHHRHHRAVVVEQLWIVHRGLLRAVIEHVLIARDGQHLRITFIGTRRDLPHRVDQRHRGLHPRLLLQQPTEAVGLDQGFVFQTALAGGFDHHGELVAGQRVIGGDVGVVTVVTRVRPQLGGARV